MHSGVSVDKKTATEVAVCVDAKWKNKIAEVIYFSHSAGWNAKYKCYHVCNILVSENIQQKEMDDHYTVVQH